MTDIMVSKTGSFSFWFFPSLQNWGIHFNSFGLLQSPDFDQLVKDLLCTKPIRR